jgi:hypothetical protein
VRFYGSKGRKAGPVAGQSWTTLSAPVQAGAVSLTLDADAASAGWASGDRIIVATTDYDPRLTEERTVAAANNGIVTLTEPLGYYHHGSSTGSIDDVERAEVALLSRTIVIAASDPQTGGHTIATRGFASVVFSGVEFRDLGLEEFGRYPVHFHKVGSDHGEALVEFNAVHGSRFRCITVHATANVRVVGNVCYNNRGHNIFFEDGNEYSVWVEGNLVVGVQQINDRPPLSQINALRADRNSFVSAYWFKSADNITVRDNVAAGAEGVAYMFAFCAQHNGDPSLARTTELSTIDQQWADFSGNLAHSYDTVLWNEGVGNTIDQSCRNDSPSAQQSPIWSADGRRYVDWIELRNFGMYKIFRRGIWARSTRLLWNGGFCSDSTSCVETLQGGTLPIRDSIIAHVTFIGQSANKGNMGTSSAPDGRYQRTLDDTMGNRVKPAARWLPVNEGDTRFCFANSCKGLQSSAIMYDGPDLYTQCNFFGFSSPKYCAFSPRFSWDNNQHSTATELHEPVLEANAQLSDLVCVLPGPGFDLSTPDRMLFNMKVTQAGATSWLVRDHPFYTNDGIGNCVTISTGDNPLAQCHGVRFAMALVGRDWVRNSRNIELPLSRTHAAVPMKVGGVYTTSHPQDTWELVFDYEGAVTINNQNYGHASTVGIPYKLATRDHNIPDDHACRLPQTCNPSGSSGLCLPAGGGYGLSQIHAQHFECLCRWGNCCEAGHRCFQPSQGRRLFLV